MQPDCCSAWRTGEMKGRRQGSLSDGGARSWREGAGLCEESGWREQEEEEMSDSGRWRRGLGMPNWIPKALESAPLVHKKKPHTHSQNTWKVSQCEGEATKTWNKASGAAQPAAKNGSAAAANKGLMPSGGPRAAPLSRNGRVHQIQLHKPHWNLTPVSMETNVSHSAQKHAKC